MIRSFIRISATALLLSSSGTVWAQAAADDETGIKDIVVTAQRRNESVQDVPIAISAFSSDQLEAQGINNTLQLGQYVPNLFALNNTGLGSANGYYLRGLGNTESIATFDPPVGTSVDDIYLSRQNANNLSLLDVERIEVLRGPQGTLFGRNTTGGAISVIMRDPGKDFGGYVEAGYGRFGKVLVRGSVDAPLADSLGVKLSGFIENDKGYVRNVTTGDRLNDSDAWGARLGIKGQLSDSVSWRGSFTHLVNNGENILNFLCNPNNAADCKGRFITTGLLEGKSFATSLFAPLVISGRKANFGQGNYTQTNLVTSNLEFGVGDNLKLNLITGFVDLKQQFALDFFDGRGGPGIAAPNPAVRGYTRGGFVITNDGKHSQFTQEVKLGGTIADGKFVFVTGAFYIKEDNRTDFADVFSLSPTLALLLADRTLNNTAKAWAGYFQGDFHISETLKVTAGIRYTSETKTFDIADNRASCNDGTVEATCVTNSNMVVLPPTVAAAVPIPRKLTTKLWTPRFAINYRPNDDTLFFVSATRGFKSGGWNARASNAAQLLPFGPEKVWSYEAGIKADFLDRRVRANLTFFLQDTSDLQTPSAFLNPTTGAPTFITRNFADYRNKGIEAEFTFAPVEGMNIFANIGFQDDHYIINRNAPAVDQFGIQPTFALQALCKAAIAAGKVPGGPNTPATQPSIATCGAGIVAPDGSIASPVRTPKWTFAVGASYKAPLGGSGWTITPSVNASYASSSETGTSGLTIRNGSVTGVNGTFPANLISGDFITGSFSAAHWIVNSGLTLKGPDDHISIGIECNNCLNETYVQSTLSNYTYYNKPMEWMIRAKYKF